MSSFRTALPLIENNAATERQLQVLEAVKKRYGMVPNTYRAMANEPAVVDTYLFGMGKLIKESGLSMAELDVVFLTISFENACDYCVAAHSFTADTLSKLSPDVTNAIREGREIADPKLKALATATRAVLNKRGRPEPTDLEAFFAQGYTERHLLSVVLAISLKTLTNYTNHLFDTPVDAMFKAREWSAFQMGLKVANFFRKTAG